MLEPAILANTEAKLGSHLFLGELLLIPKLQNLVNATLWGPNRFRSGRAQRLDRVEQQVLELCRRMRLAFYCKDRNQWGCTQLVRVVEVIKRVPQQAEESLVGALFFVRCGRRQLIEHDLFLAYLWPFLAQIGQTRGIDFVIITRQPHNESIVSKADTFGAWRDPHRRRCDCDIVV
jgi:hypothetical protein